MGWGQFHTHEIYIADPRPTLIQLFAKSSGSIADVIFAAKTAFRRLIWRHDALFAEFREYFRFLAKKIVFILKQFLKVLYNYLLSDIAL
jgi:hypothetical protein